MKILQHSKDAEIAEPKTEHTYYRDLDSACVESLGKLYRGIASPERLKAMERLPTRFDNREVFEREYQAATGEKPNPEVAGFSSHLEIPAHVSTESPRQVPEITMHERLHQLSNPRAAELLGTERYEGVTQDLALEALGQEPAIGEATGYPEQRELAHKLRGLCGDNAIEKVYFKGDPAELKACLERNLGDGGADRLRKKLRTLS